MTDFRKALVAIFIGRHLLLPRMRFEGVTQSFGASCHHMAMSVFDFHGEYGRGECHGSAGLVMTGCVIEATSTLLGVF
jgi:hypothetical protein